MKMSPNNRLLMNKRNLNILATVAITTLNKLSNDNKDILFSPTTVEEFNETTEVVNGIISMKIKNSVLKED